MSHVFPAILKRTSSSVTNRQIILELSPEHHDMYKDLLSEVPGKQCLIALYFVEDDEKEIVSAQSSKEASKSRLMRQIYGMIGEYATTAGVNDSLVKDLLKTKLQAKQIIKESLTELDEHQAASAVLLLRTQLHPNSFDYARYKNN